MAEVKVSVIVAIYNVGKYLRQCLETIVGQTLREIEIICVNDCSTDDSLEILQGFAGSDERIRVITLPYNSGNAATPRNTGLKEAQGKYLSFLDGDDYFEPTMLEKMYKRAEELDSDVVICDYYDYKADGTIVDRDHYKDRPGVYAYLRQNDSFSAEVCPDRIFYMNSSDGGAWSMLVRRSFSLSFNLSHSLSFNSNYSLDDICYTYCSLALAKRISFVSARLIYYRHTSSGQYSAKSDYLLIGGIDALASIIDVLRKHGVFEDLKECLLNRMLELFRKWIIAPRDVQLFVLGYSELRVKVIQVWGIDKYPEQYFYDKETYYWIKSVCEKTSEDYTYSLLKRIIHRETVLIDKCFGKRIIIYGAGYCGAYWFGKLFGICDIVMWVDMTKKSKFVSSPDEIKSNICYDAVLVAINSSEVFQEVKAYLSRLGVPNDLIIWMPNDYLQKE